MKTAVIYARYSSSNQREESIEGQIRECTAFAETQNYTILRHYIDRAISGKTDARPEFRRMVADSAARRFDAIIVYTLDRFARNRYDSAVYKYKLKQNGVRVLSAKEHISDDPTGIILEAMLEGFAEYYSAELAQKVTRGMTENALAGRYASGIVPFGFARDADRHLIKNPATNAYLRRAFEMAAAGNAFVDIADYLNANGVKNAIGGTFNKHSFRHILTNPIAVGVFRWNDVTIKNYIEPTVSPELFRRVQERLAANKRKGAAIGMLKSEQYLLTPNIYCGECGQRMNGMSGVNSQGRRYNYYVCGNTRRHFAHCATGNIPSDALEDAIYKYCLEILADDIAVASIADAALRANAPRKNPELDAMRITRRKVKQKITNLVNAVSEGIINSAIKIELDAAEDELKLLEEKIAAEEYEDAPVKITKKQAMFFLRRMAKAADSKERILTAFVNKVVVAKEKDSNEYLITVSFNYDDGAHLRKNVEFVTEGVRENDKVVIHPRLERGTP